MQGVLQMAVKSIVVVADVQTDRARLECIVSKAGFDIVRTTSGAGAVDAVSDEQPDLVLMDTVLDDMDGFRICRDLHTISRTRDIPVIIIADKGLKVDRLWAEQQGASGHIVKPYTAVQVLEKIRRFD